MRSMIRVLVLMSVSVGLLSACGPSEDGSEAPPALVDSQVEQGIGQIPNCAPGGYLQQKITWNATCQASCTEVGGDGSWPNGTYGRQGSLSVRCCSGSTCGSWKLIRPVCEACELN